MVGRAATIRLRRLSDGIQQRCENTYSGICDFTFLDGNVEVNTNKNTLSFEIEVSDSELVGEGHGGQR
jgi:hypothetical protein